MFRDLKEYQEIAKIYTEKVSKPEDLEERVRGGGMKSSLSTPKPVTVPQKGAGGGVGNPTNVRGSGAKPNPLSKPMGAAQGRTKRPQPEIKKFPSTAEIRAKSDRVGGGNAGASTDAGLASTANMPKATPVSAEPKKPVVSTTTKQGKPRTKAQMMAAKRIADGKSISDVKQSSKDAMKARAAERFAAFKAKRAEKKAAMEEYTPYDIVLEYLLSSEQVATIEEANYVMTEMDAETIQAIVKEGSMDVPPDVKAAAKRQYKAGSPGAEPYTVDDKKTIINYYKNKKGKV